MATKKQMWKTKNILDYALKKYHLSEGFTAAANDERENYKKTIRKTMREKHILELTTDPKTGNYIYELPEKDAKYLVDVTLEEYFTKRADVDKVKKRFAENDAKINEEERKRLYEYFVNAEPDDWDNSEGINIDFAKLEMTIDRMMIRGMFHIFYDFDEASFKDDYIKREGLITNNRYDDETDDTVKKGFSELDHKLKNPLETYCTKKK